MPNHVKNTIIFSGEKEEIAKLMDRIKYDEYGLGTIDFEKIIPKPDNIYQGDLGPKEREIYGSNNWYDWNIANWGTKWNSYGYNDDENHDLYKNDRITFNTAWSAPHTVIQKLSEMFPDVNILHKWADEDIGNNLGEYEYEGGERIKEHFPDTYKEDMDFALEMWGLTPSELRLVENALGTDYIRIDDNEYELIEIEGQKALFSNLRLTKADIPKGMYVYHLRENDEGNFCSIEPQVLVNLGGSVITKTPIDFNGADHISLDEESSPNFLGEQLSFEEFMELNEQSESMEVIQ